MSNTVRLEKLFEPIRVGRVNLKNRIVMPPMGTNLADADGLATEEMIAYYAERAKGGAGLVIIESTVVQFPIGRATWHLGGIYDDKCIPGYAKMAEAIHKAGAKCAVQLQHAGNKYQPRWHGLQPIAPSAIAAPGCEVPREMTVSEIEEMVLIYARAAERVKKAGFDAVEVHAAHGYLVHEFLSPAWNKRTDAYGGSLGNRAKFLMNILKAVKGTVGPEYTVWIRLHGTEEGAMPKVRDGTTLDEAQEVARMVEKAGMDAISVTADAGAIANMHYRIPPGYMMPWFEAIKKAVNLPVMAVGSIDPELGERILEAKKADLICMGRALIADPWLPNKLLLGGSDDIIPCIRCAECQNTTHSDLPILCAINAATGREREYVIEPAEKRKKVLVVGAGLAGMEAARVAALRGHEVLLYEKSHRFGGQLLDAMVPPGKGILKNLLTYLVAQIRKLGVKIELGEEVTPSLVKAINPDAVILATGARPLVPRIAGIQEEKVVTAQDVLSGRVKAGDRVAIVGGGLVGLDTADFLGEKGKKVTVLEMLPEVGRGIPARIKPYFMRWLDEERVTLLTSVKIEEIKDRRIEFTDVEGKRQTLEVDTVVFAAGSTPNNELFNALQGKVPEIHLAGDCAEPRNIMSAIHDGNRVGRLG